MDIKTIKDKLQIIAEQSSSRGRRPDELIPRGVGPAGGGSVSSGGGRMEPKYDLPAPGPMPTPEIPPLAQLPKPRIKLQPGETPAQAIERIRRTAPTLKDRVPEKDSYGRIEPTLETNTMKAAESKQSGPKFPGYWRGTDSAKKSKSKMVGADESKNQVSERAQRLFVSYKKFLANDK